MEKLTKIILSELENTNTKVDTNSEIYKNDLARRGNEFLFILKPEVFFHSSKEQIQKVLDLVFDKFRPFGIQVDNIRLLNSKYLKRYNVIAEHYGVINSVSRAVKQNMTEEAITNFRNYHKKDFYTEKVFGSLEILNSNSGINDEKLAELWKSCEIKRLSGGIYSGEVEYENETIYIINGFHPPQLNHFISNGREIITMNISGDVDWQTARQKLIGITYPEKAERGTLRRELFEQFRKFGFEDVSYVINSVHLSAGPLEGLIELMRFNTSSEPKPLLNDFLFGQLLEKSFPKSICKHVLTNPTIELENKASSLFDLTEEMNSEQAIQILKQINWKP